MQRAALRQVLVVYAVVAAVTAVVTRLHAVPLLADNAHLVVAALFLLGAVRYAHREEHGMERFGIDLAGVLSPPPDDAPVGWRGKLGLLSDLVRALPSAGRELAVALAVAAIVFPPFAVGYWLWYGPTHPFTFRLPDDPASYALAQIVVVALPEEAFFRGFVQTRLGDAFPRTRRLLGADVSLVAIVGQAALFALVHFVVDLSPARLAVFFPGLLFGWLRARRGGIGAGIWMHALSNVWSATLQASWLS